MLHGPHGEDGTLAALCDLADVPWVGSPLGAGALAMDKWATKLVAGALGIATAPARLLTRADAALVHLPRTRSWSNPSPPGPATASPWYAKRPGSARPWTPRSPSTTGSSSRTSSTGREIDVAVLGRPDGSRVVAPALEIVVPDGEIFDHAAKYGGSPDFLVPAPLDEVGPQGSSSRRR